MSGIVGIFHLDRAPVDRAMLEQLTGALAFRGPDAQNCWSQGPVGFGHTLLRTTPESDHETQPLTLDGNSWIVADARVDGRQDLIAKLASHGQQISPQAPDVELILRAYHLWGEQCVHHLIGDFVFAIWNSKTRRLFCARDHFGIRPLFYARLGDTFIFSNTLNCIRKHPGVSGRINELAIADFLMFDYNQELDTTAFADILRLPPAATLAVTEDSIQIRTYWRLPEVREAHYARPEDCLEQFAAVLDLAVSDRLRGPAASILLSGGLDSPTVAISARRVLNRRNANFDFRAYTIFHEKLIPHHEKHYAGLVATSLQIPVTFLNADTCKLFDQYSDPHYSTAEPIHCPMGFGAADPFRETAQWSRTALTGFGGDPVLASLLTAHFRRLWKAGQIARMFRDAASFFLAEGRLRRLYIVRRFRRYFGRVKYNATLPAWLNPELMERLALRDRWELLRQPSPPNQSARPEGYELVASPFWTHYFESYDCGTMGLNLEVCHPFFDLRLLNFLLALPVLPWCSDKEIFRRAAKGILPDAVRLRGKSPLIQDPIWAMLQKPESAWVDHYEADQHLAEFVVRDRVPRIYRIPDAGDAWMHSKPLSLNFWLQRRSILDTQPARPLAPEALPVVAVPV